MTTDVVDTVADKPADIVTDAAAELEDADPADVLRWAADTFGQRFCLTASMADTVLLHLASRVTPDVDVVFLDTGYHFPETLQTRDEAAAAYGLRIVTARPDLSVEDQAVLHGPDLFARDPDLCCAIRKVAPLDQALAPYHAWGSGLRRDEALTRRNVPVVGWDAGRGKVKLNPLARWTQDDVDRYAERHSVVVHPLRALGYPSIGCAPCTRPVAPGEDPRAGRWAGSAKSECGIHR
jgi:phosphoadenosine phosphosulfate reductase